MKAFQMQEGTKTTIEQKIEAMKQYSVGDLLYLLREIESEPKKFDERIITSCTNLLFEKNIICI